MYVALAVGWHGVGIVIAQLLCICCGTIEPTLAMFGNTLAFNCIGDWTTVPRPSGKLVDLAISIFVYGIFPLPIFKVRAPNKPADVSP